MKRATIIIALVLLGCSLENREGVDASCEDLGYGAVNDCADGIITSCKSGKLLYKVCEEKKTCEQSWQEPGAYRCNESDPLPELAATATGGGGSEDPSPDSTAPEGFPACGWSFQSSACASCVISSCCMIAQTCADDATCTSCATRTGAETPCASSLVPTYDDFLACQRSCGCEQS